MNEDKCREIFDRAMSSRGGIFTENSGAGPVFPLTEEIRTYGQAIIDYHQHSPHLLSPMPYVHLNVVDSLKVNAVAFIDDDVEFIGIYLGTILALQNLFCSMLARRNFFLEVGNPDLEDDNPELLPLLTANFEDIYDAYGAGTITKPPYPNCPVREQYAHFLWNLSIRFLICHEIGHLRNGHVHLVRQLTGRAFILEMNATTGQGLTSLTNQVLEWDADSWAASEGAGRIATNTQTQLFEGFGSPLEGITRSWGVAIWAMFRLFRAGRPSPNPDWSNPTEIRSLSYPPLSFRHWTWLSTAHESLLRNSRPDAVEVLKSSVKHIIGEAEGSINAALGKTASDDGLDQLLTVPIEYSNLLDEHWKTVVRPMLSPFSRAQLAE